MEIIYLSKEAEKTVDDIIYALAGATIKADHDSEQSISVTIGKGESHCRFIPRQKKVVAHLSIDNDLTKFDEEERAIHYTNRLFVLSIAAQSPQFPLVLLKQLEAADLPPMVKTAIKKNPKYF